jgi:hypothetical protein
MSPFAPYLFLIIAGAGSSMLHGVSQSRLFSVTPLIAWYEVCRNIAAIPVQYSSTCLYCISYNVRVATVVWPKHFVAGFDVRPCNVCPYITYLIYLLVHRYFESQPARHLLNPYGKLERRQTTSSTETILFIYGINVDNGKLQ